MADIIIFPVSLVDNLRARIKRAPDRTALDAMKDEFLRRQDELADGEFMRVAAAYGIRFAELSYDWNSQETAA